MFPLIWLIYENIMKNENYDILLSSKVVFEEI